MPELEQLPPTQDEPTDQTDQTDQTEQTEQAESNDPGVDTGTTGPTEPVDEAGTDRSDRPNGPGPTDADRTLEVDGASVTVSGDPTEAEAAVVAAVVAEHLRAEADATDAEEPRYAIDPWCLAGRFGIRSPRRVPNACPSGTEWKAARRATTW